MGSADSWRVIFESETGMKWFFLLSLSPPAPSFSQKGCQPEVRNPFSYEREYCWGLCGALEGIWDLQLDPLGYECQFCYWLAVWPCESYLRYLIFWFLWLSWYKIIHVKTCTVIHDRPGPLLPFNNMCGMGSGCQALDSKAGESETVPSHTPLIDPVLRQYQKTHRGIRRNVIITNVQHFQEPWWVSNELFAPQTKNDPDKTQSTGAKTFIFSTSVGLVPAGAPEPM